MIDLDALFATAAGIAVRLVIPILVTAAAVYLLRRLDTYWQWEARHAPVKVEKPACWETKGCSPERRKDCLGYSSAMPCWQARRTPNGYLREQCLECKIFLKAPIPHLA